jgi:hypothetical protein
MNQGGESQPDLAQIESLDISAGQKKRAKYLWVLLETGSAKEAAAKSGLGEHAKSRVQAMLAEKGTIEDAPRSGRPLIYTNEVLKVAVQILVDWENGFATGQQLIKKMVSQELVPHNSDVDNFLCHLHVYARALGHMLVVNSTKSIFFLRIDDVVDRVKYAHAMTEVLKTKDALDMLIFVDETTVEESPHPQKGKKDCELYNALP